MDRETLADVVYLVHHHMGFDGVYVHRGAVTVVVADDMARVRAAANLTALTGVDVNITSCAPQNGVLFEPTNRELAAAHARDDARRAAWAKYQLPHVNATPTRQARAVLVVSASARRYADALVALSAAPLDAYGTTDVANVLDMLAVYRLPKVIVLDASLEGTRELHERVRAAHPSRFGEFSAVQWIAGPKGLLESDVERILAALRTHKRHIVNPVSPFAHLRILVVDAVGGSLGHEVANVTSGANMQVADGWTALQRLDAESFDLVVARESGDVGLPSLVRFVKGCEPAPPIVIANEAPTSRRLRAQFPHVAHFFVDRPIHARDLLQAIERRATSSG